MFRVLYIEDEKDMVEDVPPVLREHGLEVVATRSIEQGLQLFETEPFDAVLLDICMPPSGGMSLDTVEWGRETGIEVARRLRARNVKIPVIALTVVKDPEIRARMQEAGISYVINKPADPLPIAEALVNAIRRARVRREA